MAFLASVVALSSEGKLTKYTWQMELFRTLQRDSGDIKEWRGQMPKTAVIAAAYM